MFLLAVVVVVAICLLDQDAVAAQPLGITLPEDPTKAYITLGILFVAAIMFFTEVVPLPVTALLVPIALSLTHVITSKVAFSYFGNPTVVLFMAMFIVGEATFITGFADKVGALAVRLSKGNPIKLLVYAMAAVGLLSTVLSNTGTTVVAVPMVMGMCLKAKLAPGKVLMPVAFAASLGGTVSLVGTPPNGIINSMLQNVGLGGWQWFEAKETSMASFIFINLFTLGGSMILWLAQLKNVPVSLYESARLDGAGKLRRLVSITIPICSPMILYNVIMSIIGVMQTYAQVITLTGSSGAGKSLFFYVMNIYDNRVQNFGYACALSFILFALIGGLTAVVMKTSKWVYYTEEG